MRTRTRSNIWDLAYKGARATASTSATYILNNGKKWYPPYTELAAALPGTRSMNYAQRSAYPDGETITDAGGPFTEYRKGIPNWNDVNHNLIRVAVAPWTAVGIRGTTVYVDGHYASVPTRVADVPAAPSLSAYQIAAMYGQCYTDLIPEFEGDMSLANFIYELKDFKGLLKSIPRAARHLKRIPRSGVSWDLAPEARPAKKTGESDRDFTRRLNRWRRGHVYSFFDTMSTLDLTYSFAIRPFFRDLQVIMKQWNGLSEAVAAVNRQGSIRNVRHATRIQNLSETSTGTNEFRVLTLKRNVYRLTAEMTYRVRPTDRCSQWLAWQGLRMSPKKAWDMLPFSWLLDHYCNIGEALGSFDAGEVDFDMTRLMESVTSEVACIRALHPTYFSWSHFSGGTAGHGSGMFSESQFAAQDYMPLTCTSRRQYVRQTIEPVPYVRPPALPMLQIPTCDQLRVDLDLLYQHLYHGSGASLNPSWRR